MDIRDAERSEIELLTQLWYDGWQDAHADILPEALKRIRTSENFRERLGLLLSHTRVAGNIGEPLGFCIVKDDELYQLFVSKEARGTGLAAALIADAETKIAANGFQIGWLACAIGNDRAARFYEKSGWNRARTIVSPLETPEGEFDLEVWRYEKSLVVR